MKKYYFLLLIVFFCIASFAQTITSTQAIHVEAGWNLISLPLSTNDSTKISLFPTAASSAFIYQNSYEPKDTLRHGYGFWLKFDSAQTIPIVGDVIYDDTIEVNAGWNMIGSLTVPIAVSTIKTLPSDTSVSDFFGYTNGKYQSTDTLQPGFGYWVKVYQNGLMILRIQEKYCPETPTVTYAGKIYNTVKIGDQCWLKENLDIGTMVDSLQNQTNDSLIEKYCYRNDPANCTTYGGLYQWGEAMHYSSIGGAQGICPTGWHVPTFHDFFILTQTINNDGNALKEVGQGEGLGAGTNTSGFSALFAGYRDYNGTFKDLGNYPVFWSSSKRFPSDIIVHFLTLSCCQSDVFLSDYYYQGLGYSVRCIKN
jgi:uncharacterized protein (TIGR02145 family)